MLFTNLVIDVYEERDIATFNVTGPYLQAKMPADKNVILKLRGHFVDIMCDINKEYRKYVRYEQGKKVLYLKVLREIYDCIESALQWYSLYTQTLKSEEYIYNEYDRCVANKNINGKQCTVAWYLDDNKASHVDSRVIDELLDIIKTHVGEINITIGKKHTFLGMSLRITEDKKIEIEMEDQLMEAIELFGEELEREVMSPAQHHLFQVKKDDDTFDKDKKEISTE